jgi:hypothetical protein
MAQNRLSGVSAGCPLLTGSGLLSGGVLRVPGLARFQIFNDRLIPSCRDHHSSLVVVLVGNARIPGLKQTRGAVGTFNRRRKLCPPSSEPARGSSGGLSRSEAAVFDGCRSSPNRVAESSAIAESARCRRRCTLFPKKISYVKKFLERGSSSKVGGTGRTRQQRTYGASRYEENLEGPMCNWHRRDICDRERCSRDQRAACCAAMA